MNDGAHQDTDATANAITFADHGAMRKGEGRSLCAPDPWRSCFGCCPPIRPAHYDPLDWVSSLKREFRENRELFSMNRRFGRPIIGFSCWALGYLDPGRAAHRLPPPPGAAWRTRPSASYGLPRKMRQGILPAGQALRATQPPCPILLARPYRRVGIFLLFQPQGQSPFSSALVGSDRP